MTVLPIEGQGTQIAIAGTVIGGTRSFDGLGSGSPSERDRTTFADTQFRNIGIGLRDGGTINVGILLDSTDQGQRLAYNAWRLGTKSTFTITFTNGVVQTFSGFVMQFSQNAGVDADLAGSIQIRVTGAITGFPGPS